MIFELICNSWRKSQRERQPSASIPVRPKAIKIIRRILLLFFLRKLSKIEAQLQPLESVAWTMTDCTTPPGRSSYWPLNPISSWLRNSSSQCTSTAEIARRILLQFYLKTEKDLPLELFTLLLEQKQN